MTTKTTLSETEKRSTVDALALAVAAHLTGWTVKPRDPAFDGSVQHEAELINADRLEITLAMFRYGLDPSKVHVAATKWPIYTHWDLMGPSGIFSEKADGYVRDNPRSVQASDLRDPYESVDSITVSVARGAETVAKEIARRLIPVYEKVYARCLTLATQRQAYEDKTKAVWLHACEITGGKVWRTPHSCGGVDVECRHSETVRITANLTPEKLKLVLAALAVKEVTA